MPEKKLLAIVTMFIFMGSQSPAQQTLSFEELLELESLIAQKDCGALYSFIVANPRTTFGNDPLAVELRSFQQGVVQGQLDCFAPDPVLAFRDGDDPRIDKDRSKRNEIY